MNFSLLDHPLDIKSLRRFDMPGVYIFLPMTRTNVERMMQSGSRLLSVLLQMQDVLYIGKAKRLNHRLQNYRRAGSSSAGEWQKTTKLNEHARCVLLVPTPTHFEACILEVFLIRLLQPQLNLVSTGAGRLYFVMQDKVTLRLYVSSRRKSGAKVWGAVRSRSQVRPAFEALADGLEAWRRETGEVLLNPVFTRFGRSASAGRLIVDVSRQLEEMCCSYLRGRRVGLVAGVWKAMKKAAASQQFHMAAHLRDRYVALRDLQLQLSRSRKILRRYRNTKVVLPPVADVPGRTLTIEKFVLNELQLDGASEERVSTLPFASLLQDAINLLSDQMSDQGEIERLRVNFEFLRLMLWWHGDQSESGRVDG